MADLSHRRTIREYWWVIVGGVIVPCLFMWMTHADRPRIEIIHMSPLELRTNV